MPHPLEVIYKQTIIKTLKNFIERVPYHYERYTPNALTDDCEYLLDQYSEALSSSIDQILIAIARDISAYLNYYNIVPKGSIDEFKAIYFTGRVLSRFLQREGYSELRRITDHTTIELLDFCLAHQIGSKRTNMSKALHKIVETNEIEAHLGKNGMYLLYKCTCNAMIDTKKPAPL